MPTKEYQEAVSELLDILENTDEELVKKIPPELIIFWEKNKSVEYIPKLDHNISLEEMNLKTKTRELIAMIYFNYLCDSEKKKDIRKIIREAEKEEQERNNNNNENINNNNNNNKDINNNNNENINKNINDNNNNNNNEEVDIFKKINKDIEKGTLNNKETNIEREEQAEEGEENLEKIREDIYMIEKEKESFFSIIIEKIKKFFRKIIY